MAGEPVERGEPLRVGVILDGATVPGWVRVLLCRLRESKYAEVAFCVIDPPPPRGARTPEALLFRLWQRLDDRLYGAPGDAFAPADARHELAGAEVVSGPLGPESAAAERVRDADLDVVLHLGSRTLAAPLLRAARYGVWKLQHGDTRAYRGAPAFFWEMFDGNAVSGVTLHVVADAAGAGPVLYRSYSATDPVSLRRGRSGPYLKGVHLVLRRLRELHEHGWDRLASLATFPEPRTHAGRMRGTPSNSEMARFLARIAGGVVRRRAKRLVLRDTWFVAFRRSPHAPRPSELRGATGFARIAPPRRRFFADPFVVAENGRGYIFFEDYSYDRRKGVIACATVNGTGGPTEIRTVLERDYHLAYPCVFQWEGRFYMIPETQAARRIELYVATAFPYEWRHERVLIDGIHAVDATLHHDGRRFWLFTAVAAEPGAPKVDELFLFHADTLEGAWHPHPSNPVVSDVRRARPGGGLFRDGEGRLIRPAQDCSVMYGQAIVLNEVTRLDEQQYEEVPIGRIDADWDPRISASHTYNSAGDFEVLDGLATRRR